MRLDQLRRGQIRSLALPTFELRDEEKLPTDCSLDVKFTAVEPGRVYFVEVKADFAGRPPPLARLMVTRGGAEPTEPVALIEHGVLVERDLTLELDGSTDRVVFWIETSGDPEWPAKMAGAVQLRTTPGGPACVGQKTRKMPTVRKDPKGDLTRALLKSSSPVLLTFGQLLETSEVPQKRELLAAMVDGDADVQLLEVAVRDLEAELDFESLDLSSAADACVAVFHPAAPPPVVEKCLSAALERQGEALPPAKVRLWRQLIRCAVLVLHRRAPDQLDELLEEHAFAEESGTLAILRPLVAWAEERAAHPESGLAFSFDESLQAIEQEEPGGAQLAATDLVVGSGLACVTADLD